MNEFSQGLAELSPDKRALSAQTLEQRGEVLDKQLAYWREQLLEVPTLQLLTDHPRPAVQRYQGATQPVLLQPKLAAQLKVLSQQEGVTLFMTLLAAFQSLLSRYTGQEDIAVGSPIANRILPEVKSLIGFFANTLVLRTNLSGNPSFRELLARVHEVTLGAYAHQDLPFEKLVEELQPERDLSRDPLFQVMFVLRNAASQPHELTGLTLFPIEDESATASFELALFLSEETDGLSGEIEYNADLFDATTIDRMVGHFQTLLESIAANPDQPLHSLQFLTEAEHHQLLVDWNNTNVVYPGETCLHKLIEAQVKRTPQATAVIFEGKQISYQELNQRANQLAHQLQALGVGPDVLVGLCMERSLEMVIAMLGVLKAGGAYVPLDPTYPRERLDSLLDDVRCPVLLTQQKLKSQLPIYHATVIYLDDDWKGISEASIENPLSAVISTNLAYMMYTSGSTGKPKGAMITHQGICNQLLWTQEAYKLTEEDRVLQRTPYSFGVSVLEIFWPLLTGACLVVARPEGHRDCSYLVELIKSQQITTLEIVPSMLDVLLEAPGLEDCRCLRRVICGGEALPFEYQQRFFAHFDAGLYNHYGPTETSIDVTFWQCQRENQHWTVPIGQPIANTQIYILDQSMHPVPIGVPGGLYIGGVGVARGYFNRPELTAEKFVPNPFSKQAGERLFWTGDLARYRSDSAIEFLGRIDFQVKLRGNRIELGEIESVLSRHPAVQEAVVVAREDIPEDKRLVAYVVPDREHATPVRNILKFEQNQLIEDIRLYLQQKLPDYMVPGTIMLLDSLPLTPNEKLDRKALPAPSLDRSDVNETFQAPRTDIEATIAAIWAEVLGVTRVGIHENFFTLGGHSLTTSRVISRVREALQVELAFRSLFEAPTVAGLAEIIQTQQIVQDNDLQLIAEIEQLSDEEIDKLLQEQLQESDMGGL